MLNKDLASTSGRNQCGSKWLSPSSTWHSAHLPSFPVFWNLGTDTHKMMWCFSLCFSRMSCCDPRNLPVKEYFNLCRWAHQRLPAEKRHLGLELCQYQHQNKCKSKSKLMCFPWGETESYLLSALSRWQDSVILSSWKTRRSPTSHRARLQKSASPWRN